MTRQTLVPSLVDVAMWLVIVTALGWRRAVGFGGGVMSLGGIVPIVIFCPMLVVGVADPSIAERGLPLLGVALAAVLVAAFVEEVAFRGSSRTACRCGSAASWRSAATSGADQLEK